MPQDDMYEIPGTGEPEVPVAVDRGSVFEVLAGRPGPDVAGQSVAGVLRALGLVKPDREKRKISRLDTAAAAKVAGVHRDTVAKWLRRERRGEPLPTRSAGLTKLRTKARQGPGRKRDRARAVAAARKDARYAGKGARVFITGTQGPRDADSGHGYERDRQTYMDLDGGQFDAMFDAYVNEGDQGVASFFNGVYGDGGYWGMDWFATSIAEIGFARPGERQPDVSKPLGW